MAEWLDRELARELAPAAVKKLSTGTLKGKTVKVRALED